MTNNIELDRILNDLISSVYKDSNGNNSSDDIDEAIQAINDKIKSKIYGFHEYVIGKDIIQQETDQAFNYARLHKALDAYIAESLKASKDSNETTR
jgi:uncharacterized sporulation protein YeaH/YhbH (DUF444 family)